MYQKMIVVGRVGSAPELRTTNSGSKVTSFTIADNHKYSRTGGEQVNEVTWFTVSVWGRTAEIAEQYLKIGSVVLVEGRMISDGKGNPRAFTTKAGEPASKFEISASNLRILSAKEAEQLQEQPAEFPF